jgi:hypothetical protein
MPEIPSYTSQKTEELLARAKRLLKESGKIEMEIRELRAVLTPRPVPVPKPRSGGT